MAFVQNIGLGILSWGAHETLRASLESYRDGGLLSLFDEAFIFFQQINDKDRAIAAEFGLRAEGDFENLGIMGGMKKIAEIIKTDYMLHLENDLPFIADRQTAHEQIKTTLEYMNDGKIKYCRMDERKVSAENINTLQKHLRYHPAPGLNQTDTLARQLRRLLRPAKSQRLIGDAVYTDAQPHVRFPDFIQMLGDKHWAVDSAVLNWSNRASLYSRRWFLEEVIPYAEKNPSARTVNGNQDLEKELNCHWWRASHYRIGVCKNGLFIHSRLDRPNNDEKFAITKNCF